jgi:hypothetical protein
MNVLRNWFRSLTSARHSPVARPRRRQDPRASLRPQLEELEPRLAPTCNPIIVDEGIGGLVLRANGDDAANTFILDHSGHTTMTTYTGGSRNFDDSLFNTIAIDMGSSADIVIIRATVKTVFVTNRGSLDNVTIGNNGSLGGILADVDVQDGAGAPNHTDLTIDDRADTFNRTVALSDTSLTISPITTIHYDPTSIHSLILEGGPGSTGANIYHVLDTPAAQTTIRMRGSQDSMHIQGDHGPLAVGGFANNSVLVGNGGSLSGIHAPVSVANIGGLTAATLTVDDSADNFADRLVTLGGTSLTISGTPLTTINYSAITALTYEGGPGSSGANTYHVLNTPAAQTTIRMRGGHDFMQIHGNQGPLTVGGFANNSVLVGNGGSLGGIHAPVSVANIGGLTAATLTVDDSADNFADRLITLNGTSLTVEQPGLVTVNYSAITALTYEGGPGSSGANTYHVLNTPAGQTTIRTRGNHDSMQIFGDQGPLTVGGFANNSVLVGNGGSLGGIHAPVSVANIGGLTAATLTVDDSADTFADRLITLNGTSLTVGQPGIVTVNYSAITALTYEGGPGSSGNNTYRVNGTPALASVTLNAHGSNDTLVGPTASTGWQITGSNAGQLSGSAFGGPFNFTGVQNLTGGSGNDAFVFADGARIDGNLSDIGAADTLDYGAYTTPVTVNLAAGTATGVGGSVSNILTLRGGAGDDSLTGNATGYTIFVASPGNDTVTGLAGSINFLFNADANGTADSTWSVTAQNSGTLTFAGATTTFSGVQNLTAAGTGADAFVFADGAGVDGNIQGSGQTLTNTLDYTAYSTTVVVNLQTHMATGVGGQVLGIQNVMGGTGGAAGVYNILVGNGGNVLTGGNGRRNLLIAGASASTLIGGNDDDILIGGTTFYDQEAGLASLNAIMAYWSGTADDYATRVANLLSGNGVPLLDATMVFDNGGGNTLTGHGGGAGELNLYYGVAPASEMTDYDPNIGEQFINC